MTTETETLTIRVTETVEYVHEVELTDELLDEAKAEGYERSASGVFDMLVADEDHYILTDYATTPENFNGVTERSVEEH